MQPQVEHFAKAALTLAGFRSFSKAMDIVMPPLCYCGGLSDDPVVASAASEKMGSHYALVLKIELMATIHPEADELARALPFIRNPSIRLIWMLFDRDCNRSRSRAGKRMLRALLYSPPDNKLVEDIHNYLRDLGRKNRNYIASRIARMSAAIHAGRIEARGLVHKRVIKSMFKAQFNQKRFTGKCRHLFQSNTCKLPAYMSKIMAEKTWDSLNSDGMRNELGAWLWLLEWDRMALPANRLNAAWWSKLVVAQTVFGMIDGSGPSYLGLKTCAWGVMAVVVEAIPSASGNYFRIVWRKIHTIHIVDPCLWYAFNVTMVGPARLQAEAPAIAHHGILSRQVISALPLLKFAFAGKTTLTVEELRRICKHLGLPQSGIRNELIERVCHHLCLHDAADYKDRYTSRAIAMDTWVEPVKQVDKLTQDLWDDWMDPDDKKEHASVGKLIKDKKAAQRRSIWQGKRPKGKGRGNGIGKGKGVGKGKGKGKGGGLPGPQPPPPQPPPPDAGPSMPDPTVDIIRAPLGPRPAVAAPRAVGALNPRIHIPWNDVACNLCHRAIGRYRRKDYAVSGPEWDIQVLEANGVHADSGSNATTRRVSVVGGDTTFAVNWLMHRRCCCR